MLTALLGLLTIAAPLGAVDARALAASARHPDAPGIRVWISSRDLFQRGDRARVFYRTERDAFVTVLRVDTDGRIQVLYPRSAYDDNYAYGGTTYAVSRVNRNEAFVVDDDPGVGYLFAVASDEPFDYRALLDGENWDVRLASGGRVHGDPMQALEEMIVQTLPPNFTDFDTHLIPYYVERRYDYPRFVCYDCHAYMPYSYWDPYAHWCNRYTLVVWHDPFYYYPSYWYPTRYYGGTRVVYVNPGGSAPDRGRYVFKSRESSDPGIDYRDRRTTGTADRRAGERYVRGTDVGGVGTVPTPGRRLTEPARRRTDVASPAGGEALTPRDATAERRRSAAVPNGREPGMTFGEPPTSRDATPDPQRRTPEQGGTAVGEAGRRFVEITNPPSTAPGLTPTETGGRRDPAFWRTGETRAQQPGTTERRAAGASGDDKPRAETPATRRTEAAPSSPQPERRAESPRSAPAAKPSAPATPSRGGGGGSEPSARPSSQPSSRGSSGPSARPSAPSSGGSRPASPGLVRRRPS